MSLRGRWIPSKIEPMIPGPNSTERGFPVRRTGSPTETPADESSGKQQNYLIDSTHRITRTVESVSFTKVRKGYMSLHRPGWWPCHPPA